MPIHLLWGDDDAARGRAVDGLIARLVDPAWASINLSRLDGQDPAQAAQALEEARTAPLGAGARLVLLQRSPFCNQCPAELADQLEATLPLVPDHCHLLLVNTAKPDGRLRTTKALQKLVKQGQAEEQGFPLPAIWDGAGQLELVQRTARELGLQLQPRAAEALSEAIGSDSARLASELEKLALYCQSAPAGSAAPQADRAISVEAVQALVGGQSTSALAVGDALLQERPAEAIALLDALIEAGEPALRIVATLSSQIRGWLWVCLLDQRGEQDVAAIAKAAGIGNPRRIYVMRKQIRGIPSSRFLALLARLLEVEAALKRGTAPGDAFRDGFLLGAAAQQLTPAQGRSR
ncbi:DNA polymerase III subunit delta [Cyanobium sp. LEGE 06143]|uniref:DNA polymerase III subunit delta n=1 Tax=Cyanobium sp. LEGE 06143 TaxID=945727 RepID=UPI0018818192|nr:DNA polymerase III subunit delta [Cyanobium sp. LEGE 06143]MBE9174119.1 DNA polymerase III subunit delta [Cyanobium sp. LEGE 06143]